MVDTEEAGETVSDRFSTWGDGERSSISTEARTPRYGRLEGSTLVCKADAAGGVGPEEELALTGGTGEGGGRGGRSREGIR